MTECNDCGADVIHVWRHRAFETEARREVRWVCATCHPELPDTLGASATETAETTETTDGAETAEAVDGAETATATDDGETVVMTDGGSSACPDCGAATVNGQGLFNCLDCPWTGPC